MKIRNNMAKQNRVNEALRLAQVAQSKGKLNNRVTQYLQKLAGLKNQNAQIKQNYAPVGGYTSTSAVPYTNPYGEGGHLMMYSPVRYRYTTGKGILPGGGNGEYINYGEYIAPNMTPMEIGSRSHDDAFMEEWKNVSDDIKSGRLYMKDDGKGGIDWGYNKDKGELKSVGARKNFYSAEQLMQQSAEKLGENIDNASKDTLEWINKQLEEDRKKGRAQGDTQHYGIGNGLYLDYVE